LEWLKVFLPQTTIACIIVGVIVLLFVGWLAIYLWNRRKLKNVADDIKNCKDVKILQDMLRQGMSSGDKTEKVIITEQEYEDAFTRFCEEKAIKDEALKDHIYTIYKAGISESRLEIGLLTKHTLERLFAFNAPLRSIFSVFVVLGFLGTLIGLADSVTQLSIMQGIGSDDNVSGVLISLLGHLQGAFSTSIWGVIATIACVLFSVFGVQGWHNKVKNSLEEATAKEWVPRLFPGSAQKLVETLKLSEEQMQRNFEAAKKVASFAEETEGRLGEFRDKLGTTNYALDAMAKSSTAIDASIKGFLNSIGNLTEFQEQLKNTYEKIVNQAETNQQSVKKTTDLYGTLAEMIASSQKTISDSLHEENKNLTAVVEFLRSYEESSLAAKREMDDHLKQVVSTAASIVTESEQRGQAVIDSVTTPLAEAIGFRFQQQSTLLNEFIENSAKAVSQGLELSSKSVQEGLSENAKVLDNSMDGVVNQLDRVVNRFNTIDSMMNIAAESFTTTVRNFDRRLEDMIQQFGEKIEQSNQKMSDNVTTQLITFEKNASENRLLPLYEVRLLNENLSLLVEGLTEVAASFNAQSGGRRKKRPSFFAGIRTQISAIRRRLFH